MKKIHSKDKKKYIIRGIILLVIGIVGLIFAILSIINNPNGKTISDSKKFEKEYESLNGEKTEWGTTHLSIDIDDDNPIKYVSYNELMEILEDGTGIIYFGFPECPWCRNALPVLLEAADERDINEIYYFNAHDMRDVKSLDDNGNIVTEKEGTKEYYKIVEKLYDHLDVYEGLNDDSIKRLYFPNVFFISNGEVVGNHMSTLDSQTDPSMPLNEEQSEELEKIYIENIDKVYNYKCNGGC